MAKRVYVISLPDDFDFGGRMRSLRGARSAYSAEQAVRLFICYQIGHGPKGEGIYQAFKAHVAGKTAKFTLPGEEFLARHYATEYGPGCDEDTREAVERMMPKGAPFDAETIYAVTRQNFADIIATPSGLLGTIPLCAAIIKRRSVAGKPVLIGECGPVEGTPAVAEE